MIGGISGTQLKPSPAYSVKKNVSILEASQIMAARRTDVLLVVEEDESLIGIFTTKDIAFKAIVANSDVSKTSVVHIATNNPICISIDTTNMQALESMIDNHIRHLPVSNYEGNVVGILDIMSCASQEFDSLGKSSASALLLYNNNDISSNFASFKGNIDTYDDSEMEKMLYPRVGSISNFDRSVVVNPTTTIYNAAIKMCSQKTTAALVLDNAEKLVGILTTKDIVLRVIAAGQDANKCTVQLAMTPHPDTISSESTCFQALKQMHKKKYLNIPVINNTGLVGGIVGVLNLCVATINAFRERNSTFNKLKMARLPPDFSPETQPQNDLNNFTRNSISNHSNLASDSYESDPHTQNFDIYHTSSDYGMPDSFNNQQQGTSNQFFAPDLQTVNVLNRSNVSYSYPHQSMDSQSKNSNSVFTTTVLNRSALSLAGKTCYKFKDPNGDVHRFTMITPDLKKLKDTLESRLRENRISNSMAIIQEFVIMYRDSDNDFIQINNSSDLALAAEQASRSSKNLVNIRLSEVSITGKRIEEYLDSAVSEPSTTEASSKARAAETRKRENSPNLPFIALIGAGALLAFAAIVLKYKIKT